MSETMYEADFVVWSEQQAEALRRLRRGERANDVDWDNLIEEVEALGRSETSTTISLLRRGLQHLLKAAAWPESRTAPHWLNEARTFLRDASTSHAPSMNQKIDLPDMYADAREAVALLAEMDGAPAAPLRADCPLTLTELLPRDIDVRDFARRLGAAAGP